MTKLLPLVLAGALGAAGAHLPAALVPPARAAEQSYDDPAEALSRRFRAVAREAGTAVVEVTARGRSRGGGALASGSGAIVDPAGILVTNRHVVDGAQSVSVRLADGRRLAASVLATDPFTDLAVLSVEAEGLPTLAFREEAVEIGEWVLALGNAQSLGSSVTAGIVSGLERTDLGVAAIEDFIQTDAAINAGNSGGPLVDLRGRVVGINTAKGTQRDGTVGIGFAIPAYLVRDVVERVRRDGAVLRAWLGIRMIDLSLDETRAHGIERAAIRVDDVLAGPARAGGLHEGDLVVAIDGRPVTRGLELLRAVASLPPGRTVALEVRRDGEPLHLEIELGARTLEMR